MKVNSVHSQSNPLLKKIRSLHDRSSRQKLGEFIIEGPRVLNEAYAKGVDIEEIVASQSYWAEGMPQFDMRNIETIVVVEDRTFAELVTTNTPCGVVGVASIQKRKLSDCPKAGTIVILDAVQDPGNLGTLIRASLAFGAQGMILSKGCVDPHNPKVVRSATGALFTLPVITDVALEDAISFAKEHKFEVIALHPSAEKPFHDLDLSKNVALLLGAEGQGLSKTSLDSADHLATIPMHDATESLNVALAGGIVLFECMRQRDRS